MDTREGQATYGMSQFGRVVLFLEDGIGDRDVVDPERDRHADDSLMRPFHWAREKA